LLNSNLGGTDPALKATVLRALSVLVGFFIMLTPLRAVILYGTGDVTANTTAPTGALADSGWQYEGQFSAFLGTIIASNYFITAKHIGGSVGDTFTFNGVNYTTTAKFPDPSTDFQIWRVAASFPTHAPLFSGPAGSEVNLGLVVFGRGTQRSSAVLVGTDFHLGGWFWGASDEVQRWGTNTVGSIYSDVFYGKLLRVPFNSTAGANEAHLSSGDSGGAVFIFNVSTNNWELAGINFAVDGPFSTSSGGTGAFNAAMFDTTGLFAQGGHAPNPSTFYSTEIAARKGFIESVVMQLTSVVSRKTHGSAGTFDVDLPQTSKAGIECRSGGASDEYTLVFTFAQNVIVPDATVSTGTGMVTSFSVAGNTVTANLTGVVSGQRIVVTLVSVNDGTNISDVQATMDVLVGDTTATGAVNSSDIAQTQSQSGQPVTAANFREDVTANGSINSSDIALVQSKSGTKVTAAPAQTDIETSTPNLSIEPLPVIEPKHRALSVPSRPPH
jgi:hypothetical protein